MKTIKTRFKGFDGEEAFIFLKMKWILLKYFRIPRKLKEQMKSNGMCYIEIGLAGDDFVKDRSTIRFSNEQRSSTDFIKSSWKK